MGYRKLGRTSAHRKAMLRNLVTALLVHGRMNNCYKSERSSFISRKNDYIR